MNAVDFAFFLIEIVGTVAFAISGAMIAIDRNLDLFGVLFLGVTTAIGGGIMRDILLGHIPPRAFSNYIYLTLAAGTALVVFLVTAWNRKDGGHRHRFSDAALNFFDGRLLIYLRQGLRACRRHLSHSIRCRLQVSRKGHHPYC